MAATTVYFVRHGTSEWNLLGKWQGQTDTLLAPEGEVQARKAGAALHAQGVRFHAVVCSDLRRASRTAAILAAACALPDSSAARPAPLHDARLRECSLGEFEGLHKSEIFGSRYAALFRRLASLPHEARIRTPYFDGLETPAQIAARALAAAADAAARAPAGGCVACVTHSVILESLLATAFSKDFEAVHTRTLAWIRCSYSPQLGFHLEEMDGISCVPSPDALALDAGAVGLAPPPSLAPRPLGTIIFGVAVSDARTAALVRCGCVGVTLAGLAAVSSRLTSSRGALRVLSWATLATGVHAAYVLASVATAQALVACGVRASVRGSVWLGLWMPRLAIVRSSAVAKGQAGPF
ncbi:hypothetical protein AB1Y20_005724 [Prymnesium parvum]|uniref:Phosphoglycerate mutase n=1 Tax=Prymnesium parvum TaxID=97485 RepID=A0AB34J3R7_PRYPA